MDRREMICQTAHELLCATGAVMARGSDEEIEQRASELERRYGLLASVYIGVLAERLVDYERAARNGDGEQARRAWHELIHVAAAAQDMFLWPLEVAQIAKRLSELARAEQREGGDDATA